MPDALAVYFTMDVTLPKDLLKEATLLVKNMSANTEDEELERLSELAVTWVKMNSNPIVLSKVK